MKTKGNMLFASGKAGDAEYPILYFARLSKDQYLIVMDAIFRCDPIKKKFAIVTEKKFLKITKGLNIQKFV